jgi:membrane-bound lytic murein transglycosylase A
LRAGPRLLLALLVPFVAACAPVKPPADRLVLVPASFADLPGWNDDDPSAALPAWRASCARLNAHAQWQSACAALARVPDGEPIAARAYFEQWLRPWRATNNGEARGLFTGYYEAELRGARQPSAVNAVPIYALPDDLVTADLGLWRAELRGQRITGKVQANALRPYEDRAAIDAGALGGRAAVIAWVDSAADAFFLHIQGSGRVLLDDGGVVHVGFAGQNGHAYVAIGRLLADRGAIARDAVTMQSIRAWMAANPAAATALMAENPSYVFFRELDGPGPVGAQGTVLTPGRSLAVDPAFVALGTPLWLDAEHPAGGQRLRRLVIAQDTGGAIKGPVRGDLFWGYGE